MKSTILTLGCLFFFAVQLAIAQEETTDVLFVGNSYTYFWNLPQQVASMAQSRNIALTTRQSTAGGVNLGTHWRGERNLNSVELIQSGDFEIVVLQDHSLQALMLPDSLAKYSKLLDEQIKQGGGDTYIYLTWGRNGNPLMQGTNNEVYRQTAESLNATLVPVGPAWAKAQELNPSIELYDPDGSHPSAIGAYLTACVFFEVITGESALGLPFRLTYKDENDELVYLNILPMATAHFLQQVAHETVEAWK